MRIVVAILALLICGEAVLADQAKASPEPKSPAAHKATEKFQKAKADLDRVYEKGMAEARASFIVDLKAAQKSALAAGDQDEAVTLAAKIKEIESQVPAEPGSPPKLIGGWDFSGGGNLRYDRNGLITSNVWHGATGRWTQSDAVTFVQREPNGGDVTVTITSDGKHALWVYQDGHVASAKRTSD